MVSVADSLLQVSEAEESATVRRLELEAAEQEAQKIRVGGTVAEQFQFGAGLGAARQQARTQREARLQQIGKGRAELSAFEKRVGATKSQISAIQAAQRLQRDEAEIVRVQASKRTPLIGFSGQLRKRIIKARQAERRGVARIKQQRALKSEGLTPIFVGGTLTGFESEKTRQSIPLGDLGTLQPSAIAPLERAKIIQVTRTQSIAEPLEFTFEDLTPSRPAKETRTSFGGMLTQFGRETFDVVSLPIRDIVGGAFQQLSTSQQRGLLIGAAAIPTAGGAIIGGIEKVEEPIISFAETSLLFPQRSSARTEAERQASLATEFAPTTLISSVILGAVRSPFEITKFGVGLVTQPIKTARDTLSGFAQLPGQFVSAPFSVGGEVVGSLIGQTAILGAGGRLIKGGRLGEFFPITDVLEGGKIIRGLPSKVDDFAVRPGASLKRAAGEDLSLFEITQPGRLDVPIAPPLNLLKEPIASQLRGQLGKDITAISAASDFFAPLSIETLVGKPGKGLESSLFFDPRGRLRVSRLGSEFDTFGDLLESEVGFGFGEQAQALIIEKTPVADFPSTSQFRNIQSKLLGGREFDLTATEKASLLEFQLRPEGKVKPLGFLSTEPEVTLPRGEILVKTKDLGFTEFQGKTVDLFRTEIKTASPELKLLFKETAGAKDTFSFKGLERELGKQFKRETGFDLPSSPLRSKVSVAPFFSIKSPKIRDLASGFGRVSRGRGGSRISPSSPFSPTIPGVSFPSPSRRDVFSPTFPGSPTLGQFRFTPGDVFGGDEIIRTTSIDGRKKRPKIKKKRVRKFSPISVSFSAVATESFGKFPKTFKIGKQDFGILPSKIRFLPLRRPKRRPALAGIRARRKGLNRRTTTKGVRRKR